MVIYAFLFGTQAGDVIRMAISGPDGTVIESDVKIKRTQAQSFRAIGKKLRGDHWPAGDYSGSATLLRGDIEVENQNLSFTLP